GFDVWRCTSPTLTTVVSPAYEMGRRAGDLLTERLKNKTFSRRSIVLPVPLQPGQSASRLPGRLSRGAGMSRSLAAPFSYNVISSMRFSALRLLRESMRAKPRWHPHWSGTEPARHYDVVIVGGGGHGLATAYYLAAEHGIRKV